VRECTEHIPYKQNQKDCLDFLKQKRLYLVLGKRAKEYTGISSEFNDEISTRFFVLTYFLQNISPILCAPMLQRQVDETSAT